VNRLPCLAATPCLDPRDTPFVKHEMAAALLVVELGSADADRPKKSPPKSERNDPALELPPLQQLPML